LAIVCAYGNGLGPKPPSIEPVSASKILLADASRNLRQENFSVPDLTKLAQTTEAPKIVEQVNLALTLANQGLAKITDFCGQAIKIYNLQQEEIDILWWLFGEHSDTSNKSFSEVSGFDAIISLPTDMGSLVRVLP
jgi:hypothetical protein